MVHILDISLTDQLETQKKKLKQLHQLHKLQRFGSGLIVDATNHR